MDLDQLQAQLAVWQAQIPFMVAQKALQDKNYDKTVANINAQIIKAEQQIADLQAAPKI